MNTQQQFIAAIKEKTMDSLAFGIHYNAVLARVRRMSSQILLGHNFQKVCGIKDASYLNQVSQDIASDALLLAIEKIQLGKFSWNGKDSLFKFLYQISKNLCFSLIKKIPHNGYMVSYEDVFVNPLESSKKRKLAEPRTFQQHDWHTENNNIFLSDVIAGLEHHISSPRLREVYQLTVDGLSDAEIMNEMGYKNTSDVRRRRYEAFKQVRNNANKKEVYLNARMAA